jgi:hypothetical protein
MVYPVPAGNAPGFNRYDPLKASTAWSIRRSKETSNGQRSAARGFDAINKKESKMITELREGAQIDSQMATIGVLSVNKLTFGFAILNERTSDRFSISESHPLWD